MSDIETARVRLHPVDAAEARRIHDRAPSALDMWAADYPFEGDLAATGAFLQAADRHDQHDQDDQPDQQHPFGYYQITRRADGLAIGGIGFKGKPDAGAVEIGYGLVPSARGHGYVGEALVALMGMASAYGVTVMRADTTPENVPSQRVLERAGFTQIAADDELLYFEVRVE